LLRDSDYWTPAQADSLLTDADELLRVIGSIQKKNEVEDGSWNS